MDDRRQLLLVCSTGGHLLQLVALREAWDGVLARLGDLRPRRLAVAARRRGGRHRAQPDEPERPEPRCATSARVPHRAPPPAAGRAHHRRRRRRAVRLDRAPVRREGRLRRERDAHRRAVAELPADPARRVAGLRAVARAGRELPGAGIAGAFSTGDLRHPRHRRRSSSTGSCARSTRLPGDEELVVQCGHATFRPARAEWHDHLSYEELVDHDAAGPDRRLPRGRRLGADRARAGRGRSSCPGCTRYGEAVDDHQVPFARRLAAAGYVTLVEDLDTLPAALAAELPRRRTRRGRRLARGRPARLPARGLLGYSR